MDGVIYEGFRFLRLLVRLGGDGNKERFCVYTFMFIRIRIRFI